MTVLVYEAVSGGGLGPGDWPASWLAEGSAIRRALVADFAAVPGVRVVEPVDPRGPNADAPAPAGVTRILADPARPIDPARLARRVDAAVLVAPETGGRLETLARDWAATRVPTLGATPDAIALCADKLRLAAHLDRLGIPTPPTRAGRFDRGLLAGQTGRVVVKPVDGAGAVDSFVLDPSGCDPDAYPELRAYPTLLVQPYRPGPALGATFLIGRDGGATLLAVGRQDVALGPRGAIRYDGGTVPIPAGGLDLAPARATVESVPGLLGLVGVDLVAVGPSGAVEVIEINPRATTSIVGLARLAPPGTIARAWLAAVLGDDWGDGGDSARADLAAIADAPPVRFRADGTIPDPHEVTS